MLVRLLARLSLAAGFLLGTYGLTDSNGLAVRLGLGFIVVGVLLGIYGLVRRLLRTEP